MLWMQPIKSSLVWSWSLKRHYKINSGHIIFINTLKEVDYILFRFSLNIG